MTTGRHRGKREAVPEQKGEANVEPRSVLVEDRRSGAIHSQPMTQKDRLLATLKLGPVCSYRFYDHAGLTHRIAARVWDLRQDGHIITSRACTLHDHESNAVLYELAESDQLSLL